MLNISRSGNISINRGDTFKVPLFIDCSKDIFNSIRFPMQDGDEVYFYLVEPNTSFKCPLIKQIYNKEDTNENNTNYNATITLLPVEHATLSCSFENLKGNAGDKGTITVTPESKSYRVSEVFNNDSIRLNHISGDPYTFSFTLFEGNNEISVEMYYEEYIESTNSEIIGESNEIIIANGSLTTPDPLPGHFANERTIYFKDIQWWNDGAAGVTA